MSFTIDKTTYATDSRFESLRNAGISYEDFSSNQMFYISKLSKSSIMSIAKDSNSKELQALLNVGNNNKMSIFSQEAVSKADAKKASAEEAYYMALAAEQSAGSAKDAALTKYKKAMTTYENGGSEFDFNKAYTNYETAKTSELAAESTRETLGYFMVEASKNAANTFAMSMFADKNIKA